MVAAEWWLQNSCCRIVAASSCHKKQSQEAVTRSSHKKQSQEAVTRSRKLEVGSWKLEVGSYR